uniref:Ribosomal protein S2 n=1 Tax=Proteromonas lacertae TaxID=42746 RepID=E2EA02_PROLC|nr:ribosomal protein S2 [Proteromonas lacertae]ADD46357.1 ribosomal protein S2 [Proteromonas lacertae]
MSFQFYNYNLKNSKTFIQKLLNNKIFLETAVDRYNLFFLDFILGYNFNTYTLDLKKILYSFQQFRVILHEIILQNNKVLILIPDCIKTILKYNQKNNKTNINYFYFFVKIVHYFSKISFFYAISKISSGFYSNNYLSFTYDSITNLNKLNILKYSLVNNSVFSNNFTFLSLTNTELKNFYINKFFVPDFIITFTPNTQYYLLSEFNNLHIPILALCDINTTYKNLLQITYPLIFSKGSFSNYFLYFIILAFFSFEGYLIYISNIVKLFTLNINNFKINQSYIMQKVKKSKILHKKLLFIYIYTFYLKKQNLNSYLKLISYYFLYEIFNFKFKLLKF